MSDRDYDEMSASEVIADLHGEGYQHPDTGEVWNGDEFTPPGGMVVDVDIAATSAKEDARKKYLKTYRNAVEAAEERLKVAQQKLDDAKYELERAKIDADRWYRR